MKCVLGWCRPRALGVYAVSAGRANPHKLITGMVCRSCGIAHARRQRDAGIPMTDFARELLAEVEAAKP